MRQTEIGELEGVEGADLQNGREPDAATVGAVERARTGARKEPYQLFERLSDEEYAALKESIREHGVSVPVEVDELGNILDGHNRFTISAELGIPCPIVTRTGMSEEEKIRYVIELNCARRQLSDEQKKALAERLLLADPEMADRWIGQVIGISDKTVGKYRDALVTRGEIPAVEQVRTRAGVLTKANRPKEQKHPYIYAPGWENWHRMEALNYLRKLVEAEQQIAAHLFAGRRPADALPMLARWAAFSPRDRERLQQLWGSGEGRKQGLVRSKLAGTPPIPEPVLSVLLAAVDQCGEAKRMLSDMAMREELDVIAARLGHLVGQVQGRSEEW